MFVPYAQSQIHGRPRPEDPSDVRIGAHVTCVEGLFGRSLEKIQEGDTVLFGYSDDRGVDRNAGRTGSAEAPDEIRKHLYKMTPSTSHSEKLRIVDFGNLRSWGMGLGEAHEEARQALTQIRSKKVRIVTLGGGHDWAYPDFADFAGSSEATHLINIDAHLDMRPEPTDASQAGHSGTPFRKILTRPSNPQSLVSVIGLQHHCNASSHIKWAHGNRVTTLFLEDMPLDPENQWGLIHDRLNLSEAHRKFALSIDMDAFSQAHSPGVSAPQPFGLDPRLVLQLIRSLRGRLVQLGIYEANPRFDRDGATARLAARFIHEFLVG
jgi:formimidoylglutamase